MTWRFVAFSAPGGESLGEVELTDVSVTRTLSGPGRLTGRVPVAQRGLLPTLQPWHATVWAELDGVIRGGGIITPNTFNGPILDLDCMGLSGIPKDQPWTGPRQELFEADPLDIVRMIWAHLQGEPSGDLGMMVDETVSGARVGVREFWTNPDGVQAPPPDYWVDGDGVTRAAPDFWVDKDDVPQAAPSDPANPPEGWKQYTTQAPPRGWVHYTRDRLPSGWEFTRAAPFLLEWWSTMDLGRVMDGLAAEAPFDYLEQTEWAGDSALSHRIRLGAPHIGARREGLRFAIGENVPVQPRLPGTDEDYTSDVLALGAGEGQAMVHASMRRPDATGVRRVTVYTDKTAQDVDRLSAAARRELGWRDGTPRVTAFDVLDHPHAPIGSFDVGDEILLTGDAGWHDLERWVRVVELTISPDSGLMNVTCMEV